MYLLIETSGSEEHNATAKHIADLAEDEYGFTVETVTGNADSDIVLYGLNENSDKANPVGAGLQHITTFTSIPDDTWIRHYLHHYYEEN